jgi:hypothetical protein
MFRKRSRCPFVAKLALLDVLMKPLEFWIVMQHSNYLPLLLITVVDSGFQASCSETLGPFAQG